MRSFTLLLFCLPALALAGQSNPLSLAETEALWRQHSRELKLAESAVSGASADVQTAGQAPNPDLSLNVQSLNPWARRDNSGNWGEKRTDSILRVDQLIERGGKRDLRVQGAEARLAASRFDLQAASWQQLALVRRAYYDLRLAQEKREITHDAADLYGRGLNAASKRQQAGDLAPVEVSRLAVDKARADNDARQAQSDLELAQQALGYLIGRETDSASLVAGDDWPVPGTEPSTPHIESRPEIRAAEQRVAAAQSDRDLARALRTRDVTVGVQYEHNGQNDPLNSVGLGVSIPLFVWHTHEGEIRRAESDYNTAQLVGEQQKALVISQVAQSRSALLAARDRLGRLDGGLLADAERVAKAAELAYSKGAMNLMDLLDARRTLRQVQLEAATARADYAKAWSDWQLQTDSGKQP